MIAYQGFALQTEREGEQVKIPQVLQQWQEGLARLKQAGYKLLVCKTATNGIPHNVLVGFDIERFRELGSVKEAFCGIAEPLNLPFVSSEFYDDSVMDGRV